MFSAYLATRDRFELWARFLRDQGARHVAEIGVYQGAFAAKMLAAAPAIEAYYLVDPWRYIATWNKPANTDDASFEEIHQAALRATEFACHKRRVLRGTTTEVIARIPDDSLDFVYIDGDHTLRGITLDLISTFPKVKDGGWITGDDFCDSIWQHAERYEPTMIFPFELYFAEAHGLTVHALPHNQFAMRKVRGSYAFIDHTGSYGDASVRRHVRRVGHPGADPQA